MGPDHPPETDVLVVGAGPTDLTVAVQARLMGARVRIVERRDRPRDWAPALAVQPRTMEVLRGLGIADDLLARGVSEVELRIHVGRGESSCDLLAGGGRRVLLAALTRSQ